MTNIFSAQLAYGSATKVATRGALSQKVAVVVAEGRKRGSYELQSARS